MNPIITTLLDTDLYKYTMQQSMVHNYSNAQARMEFHCRDHHDLGVAKRDLVAQCEQLASLTLSSDELQWLSQLPFITSDFIEYLAKFRLDPSQVKIGESRNGLSMVIEGRWSEITHFEIFLLAITSELYGRTFPAEAWTHAEQRLEDKLSTLNSHNTFQIVDFGTRRRFSQKWHAQMVATLKQRLPNSFTGTSNLHLARTLGLKPVGTMAHEWLQSHQVLGSSLRNSQKDALQVWLDEYHGQLGIALTDTISMEAFLKDFDYGLASAYQGIRHDSGDAIEWGESALAHYRKLGIDPHSKTLVFSDKLTFAKAQVLQDHFAGQINLSFGIGTYLSNDTGSPAPNIVLKLTELNGAPVAKLSDSPGKTLCKDSAYIELLKETFQYKLSAA